MANPQIATFTLLSKANILATSTSANVALGATGSPTAIVITNTSQYPAYVATGATNAVTVSAATGYCLLPGAQVAMPYAAYLAAIGGGELDVAVGQ